MNQIDNLIASATPAQMARARAMAPNFAAGSGLQAHTCPDGYRGALANIVDGDLRPTPRAASRPATVAGYTPVVTLRVQANGLPHPLDLERFKADLTKWPATVTQVQVVCPSHPENNRVQLVEALQAGRPVHFYFVSKLDPRAAQRRYGDREL